MRVELDIVINRPVQEVFAYVTDVRNLPEWQESAVEAEWEGEAPLAVGARMRERRSFLGQTVNNRLEVTAHEPDRRFDLKAISGPIHFQVHHSFEPTDGATRLRVVVDGETAGMLRVAGTVVARRAAGMLRLAGGMVERQVERKFRADLERLKEILEAR